MAIVIGVPLVLLVVYHFVTREEPEQRFVSIDQYLPIPIIHKNAPGTAKLVDKNTIIPKWEVVDLPKDPKPRYFVLLGYIKPGLTTFYVLKHGDQIYLEEGEFIEPLIKATFKLTKPDAPVPETIPEIIAGLPDNPMLLIHFMDEFRKTRQQ